MLQNRGPQNIIPKDFFSFLHEILFFENNNTFENFNISKINTISVQAAKVLEWWRKEPPQRGGGPEFNNNSNMKHQILYWGTSSVEVPTGQWW